MLAEKRLPRVSPAPNRKGGNPTENASVGECSYVYRALRPSPPPRSFSSRVTLFCGTSAWCVVNAARLVYMVPSLSSPFLFLSLPLDPSSELCQNVALISFLFTREIPRELTISGGVREKERDASFPARDESFSRVIHPEVFQFRV